MSRDVKMTNQSYRTKQQERLTLLPTQELQSLQNENKKLQEENTELQTQAQLEQASQETKEEELNRLRCANAKLQKEKMNLKNQLKTRPTQERLAKAERDAKEAKSAIRRRDEMVREIANKTEIIKDLHKKKDGLISENRRLRDECKPLQELEKAKDEVKALQWSGLETYHANIRLIGMMRELQDREPFSYMKEREREIEERWWRKVVELDTENEAMKYERFIHYREKEDVVGEKRRLRRKLEELEGNVGNGSKDEERAKGEARLKEIDREFEEFERMCAEKHALGTGK